MKILITGASGFIGRHLVTHLQTQGHDLSAAVWQKVAELNIEQVLVKRLETFIDWGKTLHNIDVVIHLAAHVHLPSKKVPEDDYITINSRATEELAKQAALAGVKRFIFLSSIKVNGDYTENSKAFREIDLANPQDPYAKSKYLAELALLKLAESSAMEVVIIRPPLVYGPGVKANFLKLIRAVDSGWPLPFAQKNAFRNFIYIQNLISAISMVIVSPRAANQIFMVADNEAWNLADLIGIIAKNLEKSAQLFRFPSKPLNFLLKLFGKEKLSYRLFGSLQVSNEKIKELTGWVPPISSQEGLEVTIRWYREKFRG